MFAHKTIIDGTRVFEIPLNDYCAKRWLSKQNYDLYLSIEAAFPFPFLHDLKTPILFWIQDPRPLGDWEEIEGVSLMSEPNYFDEGLNNLIHALYKQKRIQFISQAFCLNSKAKELYKLDEEVEITYVPNPIEIEETFDPATHPKKDHIIFLGRIDVIKRGWLFCEIAKQCPEYEFFMLGQSNEPPGQTMKILKDRGYFNVANLHFVGHADGDIKATHLKDAKILINTSIHEALPISFLEALSYGVLLVSNQNPDGLSEKFGSFVGPVLGDGFESVPKFVSALRSLMQEEEVRKKLSIAAFNYIKEVHSLPRWLATMQKIIENILKNQRIH
ncbi:glycosyltransferase family 4 protein [Helicobacter suis]|uniref:glycosyltransferase family 4 protein n=1 Tax=Helicobacter suis TaxID=104628 RepID=UPI0019676DF7|nr:glycosyltransferase family 4 protein [Helicobacter suis]